MTGDGINHGTYGGYQKHRKLGVEACAECLAAQVWYTRRRRESAEVRAEEQRQTAVLCVFCEVCTNGSAPELHTLVHPGCSVPGHDLWNHSEWALAKNGAEARSAVWAWMVRDRRDERGPETAADLIALGMCSGACLVASLESFGGCDCRCRGEWHGVLADAPVKSRWNVARMTPDPAPNADTGVVTLGDLPEPVPSPWPHFPHCPGCSRRLWAKSQRMPGPREDGTCPYCATLVVSSKWVMS